MRDDAGAKSGRDGKSPWQGVQLRPRALQVVFVRGFTFRSNFTWGVPRNNKGCRFRTVPILARDSEAFVVGLQSTV